MSWANYDPGRSGYSNQGQDPWRQTYQQGEPSGYVTHDPYAPPSYNQQSAPYAQGHEPPYQAPYGPPGMIAYAYSAANPPRPAVGPIQALTLFFKNYAVFHGRASRSEYWWMYLWSVVLGLGLIIPMVLAIAIDPYASDIPPLAVAVLVLTVIAGLGLIVPSISLQVRRLHDAGFSGFFSLFAYVPYVSYVTWLVPLVMSFFPSTPRGIKYDNSNGTQPAVA